MPHHRLLGLFYRAAKRSVSDDAGPFARRASALVGIPRGLLDARHALPANGALGRARLLSRRPLGRESLESALQLAFPALSFRVEDFVARSVRVADSQRMRLAKQGASLGRDYALGSHIVKPAGMVLLVAEPVGRATLDALLPGAPEHARLRRVVQAATGGLLEVELELHVLPGEEPRYQLGRRAGALLGVNSVLGRSAPSVPTRVRIALTSNDDGAIPTFLRATER